MNNQVDPMIEQPVEYGITPPAPASLTSPFSPQTQQAGNSIMGTVDQRQASLGNNTPLFKKSYGY
jgi:hypothetical protein|tara:strand:+ start:88 stop:282 length:195 start_codon:yes stop_codon:yes gene_type:complete